MRKLVSLSVGVVATLAMLVPGTANAATVELRATLSGAHAHPAATGWSDYHRDGSSREVEVTLTHLGSLAGARVTVFVGGRRVGQVVVSSTGRVHRDWDTEHGAVVPVASAGSRLAVRTASGVLVAAGRYALHHHQD